MSQYFYQQIVVLVVCMRHLIFCNQLVCDECSQAICSHEIDVIIIFHSSFANSLWFWNFVVFVQEADNQYGLHNEINWKQTKKRLYRWLMWNEIRLIHLFDIYEVLFLSTVWVRADDVNFHAIFHIILRFIVVPVIFSYFFPVRLIIDDWTNDFYVRSALYLYYFRYFFIGSISIICINLAKQNQSFFKRWSAVAWARLFALFDK